MRVPALGVNGGQSGAWSRIDSMVLLEGKRSQNCERTTDEPHA